jgi:predicted Rossmann fold nucleotide-binding protein DprA/Smf involved in DNA uptake
MEEKIWYIWLSKLQISNKVKLQIIKKLGGIRQMFYSSLDDLVYINLLDVTINKILDKKLKDESFRDFEFMEKNKIEIIGIDDKVYPNKLKNIPDNPICFYLRGNKKILNNNGVRNSRFKNGRKREFRDCKNFRKNFRISRK